MNESTTESETGCGSGAGRVAWQWFYHVRDEILEGGLFELIKKNKFVAVQRYLDGGSSPNTSNRLGQSLLETAIEYEQLAIAALLLYRGADPNKARVILGQQKITADDIFLTECYYESLAKFLMTYNARFEHQRSPTNSNPHFLKSLDYGPERYALYEAEQEGQQAFAREDYPLAKAHFETARDLLTRFIEEEQEKLTQQTPETPRADRTDKVFVTYYQARRATCLEKLATCQANLKEERLITSSPSTMLFPPSQQGEETLRHRTPFQPSA